MQPNGSPIQKNKIRRRPAEVNLGKTGGEILDVGIAPTRGYGSAVLVALNEALTFVPTAVIVVIQATTIRANITAYSTAVGPSSDARNFFKRFMVSHFLFDDFWLDFRGLSSLDLTIAIQWPPNCFAFLGSASVRVLIHDSFCW